MGILVSAAAPAPGFAIPIVLIFWCSVMTYVLHILEESVLGDIFVEKVRRLYWPEYGWAKFAGFNTILMTLNIAAVILFDVMGGAFIIAPLALMTERVLNGFYHLYESFRMKAFSSGLLTSLIVWILGYFIIRYSVCRGEIEPLYLIVAVAIGALVEFFMTGFMFIPAFRKLLIGGK